MVSLYEMLHISMTQRLFNIDKNWSMSVKYCYHVYKFNNIFHDTYLLALKIMHNLHLGVYDTHWYKFLWNILTFHQSFVSLYGK